MTENFDPSRTETLLIKAASSCFADMAFIDIQPASKQAPAGTIKRAIIDSMAPLSCRLEMTVPDALRDQIVATLFCNTPEASKKKNADDSLLEILNIIAGTFLSSYFGQGSDIQLSLPSYMYSEDEAVGQEISRLSFDAEGNFLGLTLSSIRYRY